MKKLPYFILAAAFASIFACGCSTDTEPDEPVDPGNTDETQEIEYIDNLEVLSEDDVNTFSEEYIKLYGRTYVSSKQLYLDNASTGVELCFYGTTLQAKIVCGSTSLYFRVFCDGDEEGSLITFSGNRTYTLAEFEEEGTHTVRIVKATSSQNGSIGIKSFTTDGKFLKAGKEENVSIEFVGDSISVGAGIFGTTSDSCTIANSDATKSYAYLTAQSLGADCSIVATEGICVKAKSALTVNMCEMYEYNSSLQHGSYSFPQSHDVVVVALGTNDGYYMLSHTDYTSSDFAADYVELLTQIRTHNEDAYIVCVYGMMTAYTSVTEGIKTAIQTMADDKISYLTLPTDNNGAESHPSQSGAVKQSETLVTYLSSLDVFA